MAIDLGYVGRFQVILQIAQIMPLLAHLVKLLCSRAALCYVPSQLQGLAVALTETEIKPVQIPHLVDHALWAMKMNVDTARKSIMRYRYFLGFFLLTLSVFRKSKRF
jgi:hypothetical protein